MSEWVRDNAPSGNSKCCKCSEKEINQENLECFLWAEVEGNEISSIRFLREILYNYYLNIREKIKISQNSTGNNLFGKLNIYISTNM